MSGNVTKGTVVALYPGVYYPPVPVYAIGAPDGSYCQTASLVRHMWDDNVYCINLIDVGGYVDGHIVGDKHKSLSSSLSGFSVGQMINHPSKAHSPNVTTFEFLWSDVYEAAEVKTADNLSLAEFLALVPNRMGEGPWFVDPSTNEVVKIGEGSVQPKLAGLAMVALDDIADGSELFFNYKLGPKDRPDWYHDPEEV